MNFNFKEDIQITKNFKLNEFFTRSSQGFNEECFLNVINLCTNILQPIRNEFGAIKITSGYRSEAHNKIVGGSKKSQHLFGEAVDIIPLEADIEEVFDWLCFKTIDQAILEERNGVKWIHISLKRIGENRNEMLYFKNGKYTEV